MHFPTFLVAATTAASTLVSARVDRLPSNHRQYARSANDLHKRDAFPEPQPYRLFAKPDAAGASSPFVKRDDASQRHKKKSQKKNQVCRKKTAEEKRKSRAAKVQKKKVEAKPTTHAASSEQKLNVDVKPSSHAAVSSSSKSSSSSSSDSHKSQTTESSTTDKVADILKPVRSLIGYSADNCGASGATDEFPNGSESWLNCGLSKSNPQGKWTPPQGVTLDHITTVSIEHALATNSVWEPCKPFIPLFERIAKEENLPAILLASFALQESTCNPHTQGDNGGAFGLMQITEDKCNGMDAKGCSEPEYNVRTAAKYFNTELSNRGGRFLEALGAYNGWYPGLSWEGATAAQYGDCCHCMNNIDYLYQMTNGWLLGRTGYEMGSAKNLAVCD
ncbi:hypothetical protein JCM16303_006685 [Sporobolomyces ruberrimus]